MGKIYSSSPYESYELFIAYKQDFICAQMNRGGAAILCAELYGADCRFFDRSAKKLLSRETPQFLLIS